MKMTKSGGDGGGGGNPKKLRRGNLSFNEMPIVASRVLNTDDRISRLPDSVICHILSFLETKLVVTTSILSKRWKFVWTGVTALDFEEEGIDSDDEYYLDEEMKDRMLVHNKGIKNIVQFVDKVLLHLDVESLEKFQLTGRKGCKRGIVHVNRWISYAIMRNVKSLTIAVSGSVKTHLPAAIFTSGMLSYLNLSRYFMLKLPPVVCLPKLEHLSLYYIVFESDECVSKLFSGCPVLHSLIICRHSQDKVLVFRVSSPSLKRLEMQLYPDNHRHSDESIGYDGKVAIDAPNLEYLEIEDCVSCEVSITRLIAAKSVGIYLELIFADADTDECNSVVKLVEALNSVQFLKLSGKIMRYLSHATIPLLANFDRLTKLSIQYQCCHWSSLSVLLGCLIKLETLEINRNLCFGETVEHCWKDPEEVPLCLSSTLARISIHSFAGLDDEMEMIRYVLEYGSVLEFIDLQVCRLHGVDLRLEMLQTISTFPRLSSVCSIKFT